MIQPAHGHRRPVNNSAIPNVIFVLLVANGLVFALQHLQFEFMLRNFALWPINIPPELLAQIPPEHRPSFMPWQLVTYGFLHSTDYFGHIFFNMFGLWMFGRDLERLWGPQRFLVFYLVCVVGAGLVQLLVAAIQGGLYPTVGASGGVFGLLLLFGHSPTSGPRSCATACGGNRRQPSLATNRRASELS